ncbi:MAG: hypothetical protein HQK59_08505 [Deltaproteobacteria bacterium]|nr:hypothetical protein [Deltaproteobacteria bacterium]
MIRSIWCRPLRAVLGFLVVALITLSACAPPQAVLKQEPLTGESKDIVFPDGSIISGGSAGQTRTLAQIFVDAHDEVARAAEGSGKGPDEIQKKQATANQAWGMLVRLARLQGTEEFNILFRPGNNEITKESKEYERLIQYFDGLTREAKGRPILLISLGSAPVQGNTGFNLLLAEKRAGAPLVVADKYLGDIPHETFQVWGIGDHYPPGEAELKIYQRYQNTRLVALYLLDRLPPLLPDKPLPDQP